MENLLVRMIDDVNGWLNVSQPLELLTLEEVLVAAIALAGVAS